MLSGVFSLLSAALLVQLDAVDVAFTEAAVGAGISTVLMLGTMTLTVRREKVPDRIPIVPLLVVFITGGALIYGTLDMPPFGSADAPAMGHVIPEYFEGTEKIFHIPNVVTAVLASYRGFDTLGEVAVVFTAGIGVLVLLASGQASGRDPDKSSGNEEGDE
jgi:multicomponent Na+:H+ antiporter subunit B